MKNILVIGFSTRNIVCSGKRAGYKMYSLDTFCDHDLVQCSAGAKRLEDSNAFDSRVYEIEKLRELIESFNVDFDAIIPGSGFEMCELERLPYRFLGNDIEIIRNVSDKYMFSMMMKKMNIAHPSTVLLSDIAKLKMPAIIKPMYSGGGVFNIRIDTESDMKKILFESLGNIYPFTEDKLIAQEYVAGIPVSVSVIATKEKAVAIAINEQLTGIPSLTENPFAYCGNITPFDTSYDWEIKRVAEELVLGLGIIGSVGVDLIISEYGPVIIEVNARVQGSLDTVEMFTGINILDAHVKAFNGDIDISTKMHINCKKEYSGRAIIYAQKDVFVTDAIQKKIMEKNVRDIPPVGYIIGRGEPVVSLIGTGDERDELLRSIDQSVMFIRDSLNLSTP